MDDEKGRVIAAFLRYFDGDPERAVAAVRQYTARDATAQTKTTVPLGSEIISVKDVVKTYKVGRQKIEVLRGVSLSGNLYHSPAQAAQENQHCYS